MQLFNYCRIPIRSCLAFFQFTFRSLLFYLSLLLRVFDHVQGFGFVVLLLFCVSSYLLGPVMLLPFAELLRLLHQDIISFGVL